MNIKNLWTPTYVRERDKNYRFTWGEIDRHWTMPRISINGWHDEHGTLVLGLVYVTVYVNVPKVERISGWGEGGYGFYFDRDALVLQWAKESKFCYYPWSWKWYKRSELANGDFRGHCWIDIPRRFSYGKIAKKFVSPYTYKLRSGEVQGRIATYYVDRTEWRMRWLMWLPWPNITQTSIDVSFNDEVGERTGSWKGGTIGCSYEMKKGELPLDTLRRMEKERIFK